MKILRLLTSRLNLILILSFLLILIIPGFFSLFWFSEQLQNQIEKEFYSQIDIINKNLKSHLQSIYEKDPSLSLSYITEDVTQSGLLKYVLIFDNTKKLIYKNNTELNYTFNQLQTLAGEGLNKERYFYVSKIDVEVSEQTLTLFTVYNIRTILQEEHNFRKNLIFRSLLVLFLIILFLLLVIRFITNPIHILRNQTAEMVAGKYNIKINPATIGFGEVSEISKNINSIIEGINKANKKFVDEIMDYSQKLIIQNKFALEAQEEAEQANKLKSEFLANVSHEIRTPMNSIIGFSNILMQKDISEENKYYLDSIINSGNTLLMLINDILDISKIEAGKIELEKVIVNLNQLINEIQSIFVQEANKKGLSLIFKVQDKISKNLIIDETKLKQILINLISNAIKFTEKGFVQVEITAKFNDETTNTANIQFKIKDSGIGIKQNNQKKIFEPFVQQEGQSTRKYGGTGLGLAITKRLIELMGGRISLISQEGIGSEFIVTLNNIELSEYDQDNQKQSIRKEISRNIEFPEATILIADDIDNNRQLVIEMFRGTNLHFLEAVDGEEAVKLANEHMPDLVIMDIKMPKLDGNEANAILKKNPQTKNIPIIALTASALKSEVVKFLEYGFNEVLVKPIDTDLLINFIHYYLKNNPKFSDYYKNIQSPELNLERNKEQGSIYANLKNKLTDEEVQFITSNFSEIAKKLNKNLMLSEIKKFNSSLINYANEINNKDLIKISKDLSEATMKFQLERIKSILKIIANI
jgi:two-component system sensor histidine kinase EvgS